MAEDLSSSDGALGPAGNSLALEAEHPASLDQEDILASLVDTVAQDVASGSAPSTARSSLTFEHSVEPANPTEVLPARRVSSGKKWPVVQPSQRYAQGTPVPSTFKVSKLPSEEELSKQPTVEQSSRRSTGGDAPKQSPQSGDSANERLPLAADGLSTTTFATTLGGQDRKTDTESRPAAALPGLPPLTGLVPPKQSTSRGEIKPIVQQPHISLPGPPVGQNVNPIPLVEEAPHTSAAPQINSALMGAFALLNSVQSSKGYSTLQQSMPPQSFQGSPQGFPTSQGFQPPQHGYPNLPYQGYQTPPHQGYQTPPQGYQMLQQPLYAGWPPQNYLVSPSAINVPQPVMQLVMPQMQSPGQQPFGAYQDFRSLMSPNGAPQPAGVSTNLPSPVLEPVAAPPPPPPFLARQESKNQGAQQAAASSEPVNRPADKASEYVPPLLRNLSRFGDTYNYSDIVGAPSSNGPSDSASSGDPGFRAPSFRDRSATTDGSPLDPTGLESTRTRAASVDTIRSSRSMNSRAGTSFSVPVREAFTVVHEEEAEQQQGDGGSQARDGTGVASGRLGGFAESVSPRGEPFLGQDGFRETPEKQESAEEGRGRAGADVMATTNTERGSASVDPWTPNEEQLLEAIMRSRQTKSFMDKAYDNLTSANGDRDGEEDDEEEEEETSLALPAIVTKKTMSPSYGTNGPMKRLTKVEKKKLAVEATLGKVLQRIAVHDEEKEAQRSEHRSRGWWARRRERAQLKKRNKQRFEGTSLWDGHLKLIEGRFGSSISLTFAFLRFVFYMNVMTSACWFLLVILPYLVSPPPTFSWQLFTSSSIQKLLQGNGLDHTFFFYGGYGYKYWTEGGDIGDQKSWYQTDYMYPLAILTMFLIGLLAIMRKIAQRLAGEGDSSIVRGNKYFPFSTLVFGSWDFHITSVEAALKLRRGIRTQLREMLNDERAAQNEEVISTGSTKVLLVMQRAFVLTVLWPLLVVGTAAVVVIAITKDDYLNQHLGSDFGQSIILALINTFGPSLVRFLVALQFWRPATAERVETTKIYVIRMINAGTLFYRLYYIFRSAAKVSQGTTYGFVSGTSSSQVASIGIAQCNADNAFTCDEGYECCKAGADYCESDPNSVGSQVGQCVTACVENVIGRLLLRFLVVNSLISNASELGYSLVMLLFTQKKRQILVPDMAIDIIYIQSLVWISAIYCPLAPFFGACLNAFTFFWMKNVALSTCAPPEKMYSASRTSNLTYGLLLVTLLLCSVPATISFLQTHEACGPHAFSSMQKRVNHYIDRAPAALNLIFRYLGNPAILGGVIALLVFALILVRAKETKYQNSMAMTQKELSNYRKETHQKISDIRLHSMGLSPSPLSVSGRSTPAHPVAAKMSMFTRSQDGSPSRQSPRSPQTPTSPQSPQPESARSVLSTSSYSSQTALLSTTRLRR